MRYDVTIIGGGAAGLMCAIEAGKRGRSVAVLEHGARAGNKILISGGGRCNFTNINAGPENYVSGNPHFCKSALARYTAADFTALVERHGIAFHEKKLGQLFCDFSSKQILDMLLAECAAVNVKIILNCKVQTARKSGRFRLDTSAGPMECDSVVVATGGLSFPKIGATDFGYRIAEQFGLRVTGTRPGLVPLVFGGKEREAFGPLSGISLDVIASGNGKRFRENCLFTHRGLSGPVILQISNYRDENASISLNLLPEVSAQAFLTAERKSAKELKTVLGRYLPQRFAQAWCDLHAPSRPMSQYTAAELEGIARRLANWEIQPEGTEGYAKAEVTVGGVDTAELSSKSMEARNVPGLYFIGEVVDVTGWLGGYNFQWAWASGHAAGQFA
jgi:predicted Rossmann fold flavoprotein